MDLERRRGTSHEDDGARCTFDRDGFRAEGVPPAFDRTVLFIGDSFTQGYGVVDGASFPAQTGFALARLGINVRTLNAGNSGAGAAQELRLLRRLLERLKVDLVVLQVFPHNDLEDNWQDGGFAIGDGRLVALSPPHPPPHIVWGRWLAEQESLIHLNAVRLLANALPPLNPKPLEPTDYDIELERLLLRETVATARVAGIPVFILVVGEQHECDHSGSVSPQHAYERVLGVVEGLGVPFLSSCAVVSDHYNKSGHFDVDGNALIGDALAQRLAPFLGTLQAASQTER
jgi:lysophospholipase L1-like esterase